MGLSLFPVLFLGDGGRGGAAEHGKVLKIVIPAVRFFLSWSVIS